MEPTIVGEGRRLFDGVRLPERLRLELAEQKVFNQDAWRVVT